LFAGGNKGGGHTESAHAFENDEVVSGVEGDFEVRVDYAYIFVVDFDVLNHHSYGR
jgi:hypothetical protein